MPILVIIALSLHVLSAVFWAGTSFTLARAGGVGAQALFRPQMGAAVVAVLTGGYLWAQLHRGGFGGPERTLAVGIACALIAAGVQGALTRRAPAVAQRIAAGLLAVTIVCMAIARYL